MHMSTSYLKIDFLFTERKIYASCIPSKSKSILGQVWVTKNINPSLNMVHTLVYIMRGAYCNTSSAGSGGYDPSHIGQAPSIDHV